jgi:hypothetical protein
MVNHRASLARLLMPVLGATEPGHESSRIQDLYVKIVCECIRLSMLPAFTQVLHLDNKDHICAVFVS